METEEYLRRRKRFEKKHGRELVAVLRNLKAFLRALEQGTRPRDAKFGFIHPEPHGVLAIDQKGGGPSLAQTRLYVYPDEDEEIRYVLNLGDKRSQSADIETCSVFVANHKKKAQEPNGPPDDSQAGPDETPRQRDGNGAQDQ